MKKILTISFCCLFKIITAQSIPSFSSDFQKSGRCQENNNVNCNPKFSNNIRATFKYRILDVSGDYGKCTGTLINRDVSQGDLGVYFISARHCHDDGDFSKEWQFFFNYQSPDCNDESIPEFKRLFT